MSTPGGKTVLVTGAAGGLGRAIAEAFLARGDSVVLADIDAARLSETCAVLGDGAHGMVVDLAEEASITAMAAEFGERHDSLDVLVNNAALAYGEVAHSLLGLGQAKWQNFFAINTIAPLLVAEALRSQLAAAEGLIINQCSMAAYVPATAYGVTKAALAAMNFAMATQFAPDGIRAVGIAPGLMEAEASLAALPPEAHDRLRAMQLAPKRGGTAQDVANACLFLASEQGAFINNTVLNVDGGHQMRGWHI